ncbi:MAG: 3-hydroxyacyl-CoA dehydrogenase [Kordiimonadaceae bacterium]|nr:3-hydroxyacyl-CoA dehydrogenase [Kordiimonadaceae bacterium]
MSVVSTKTVGNIAIIVIDNPPVNALSHAVRSGVSEQIAINDENDNVDAIILSCAGRTFCAGADITEFGKPPMSPSLPDIIDEIEMVNTPVIAALHGTALGGGFELALSCHYRIMDTAAKVGLPEVNLGLIPGASGTQRLPRLVGVEVALDMICSGKPISAEKALKIGAVDRLSLDDLETETLAFAQELLADKSPLKRIRDITIEAAPGAIEKYRQKIARKSRGFLAPFAAIRAVEAAATLPYDEGLKVERQEFMTLISSSHSIAQRHLFFAERLAGKVPGIDKKTPLRDIKEVAVIGGGIMGCGIAVNFLNKNLPLTLLEVTEEALETARSKIEGIYLSSVNKGRMTDDQMQKCMDQLTFTTQYDDLSTADLIIEAVFEDIDVKKQVFTKLDQVAKQGAILATNTSFLDINDIAASTSRPRDVIGLHFFSPAHIMPLLEIVRTKNSADDAIATALKIGKIIGKTSVVSGVCYGFIANRMSSCYGREAGLLLLEGASVSEIDQTLFDFGMPMGMFSMLDMAGIDIGVMARKNMMVGSYDDKAFLVHDALVASGKKGQKTGSGFYIHDPATKSKTENPEVEELAVKIAEEHGIKRREINAQEIEDRCIYALINEGFKIVEEGIALRASDVDVVFAHGFGFPRYRGGPLHYAEQVGLEKVLKRINEFADLYGSKWWTPSKLLVENSRKN